LRACTMAVVADQRVIVRVLHTTRSLMGVGGTETTEVKAVAVAEALVGACATGLPRARGRAAKRPKKPERLMFAVVVGG
jgi:hypothetical protein